MSNSADDIERLEGMTAMIEDWHAKVVVLVVRNFTCILEATIALYVKLVCVCFVVFMHEDTHAGENKCNIIYLYLYL